MDDRCSRDRIAFAELTHALDSGHPELIALYERRSVGKAYSISAAFEHFWNTWGSGQKHLIVVICGSAAAWMIIKVLHHKSGLHNRVTRSMPLQALNLQEAEELLGVRGVHLTIRVIVRTPRSSFYCIARDTRYRLMDELISFHLRWVVGRRELAENAGQWQRIRGTPGWQAWSGYAILDFRHHPPDQTQSGNP